MAGRLRGKWRWLHPGMRVKRWLALFSLGLVLLSLGAALAFTRPMIDIVAALGEFELAAAAGTACMVVGAALALLGVYRLVRSITSAVAPRNGESLAERVYKHHQLDQGLNVVGIGGGTGLSALLRGLKQHTSNITAIVTVSDDGGSSGRLRRDLGTLAPGDIRNCIVALADAEPLMGDWLQYRFDGAEPGLEGHSLGNLLIAGLTAISGDFLRGVQETSKVLNIRGRVLPATVSRVTLCAERADGSIARGESQVCQSRSPIRRLFFEEGSPPALPEAVEAIRNAHVIVLGPGSTFTSLLPNLLVPDIARAVAESPAIKVLVCNVMTQPGETDGFSASDHVRALVEYSRPGLVDYVLVNDERPPAEATQRYQEEGAAFVEPDIGNIASMGLMPIKGRLLADGGLVRHDPPKLADAVMRLALEELALAH
ncbi:MAG: uridine diphosphate-N-acetylglucosamine-binding protein YvcK [Armatimonadota bacterium]